MVKYRLIYFNVRGRAELARLLFAQAGVDYEDVRLTREEWESMKPNTPFGQLPILEVDGVQYGQSAAIGNYLTREFGLGGKDNLESLRCDMIGFCINDIFELIPFNEKDEKKKAEGMKKAYTELIPPLLQKLEAMLKQNKGGDGFFLNELSTADIVWMVGAHYLESEAPGILDCVPKLDALKQKVETLPNIASWIKNRPKTEH